MTVFCPAPEPALLRAAAETYADPPAASIQLAEAHRKQAEPGSARQ